MEVTTDQHDRFVCLEQKGAAIEIAKSVALAAAIDIVVGLVTKQPVKLGRKVIARGLGFWAFHRLLWPSIKPYAAASIDKLRAVSGMEEEE
jgi:hypothetical protein